jgi:hypothetical protein
MPPWRQADHYGRNERLTYLPRDVMREAIHTPVGLPPTMESGDSYALLEVKLIKSEVTQLVWVALELEAQAYDHGNSPGA